MVNPLDGEDLHLVRVRVRGQAFLYNQIRMMLGGAWAVATGLATMDTLTQVLEAPIRFGRVFPMVPAEGLVLMDAGFDRVPRMSVATDARRAAALSDPPKYVRVARARAHKCESDMQARAHVYKPGTAYICACTPTHSHAYTHTQPPTHTHPPTPTHTHTGRYVLMSEDDVASNDCFFNDRVLGSVAAGWTRTRATPTLVSDWTEQFHDKSGSKFWFNPKTGESSWRMPEELQGGGDSGDGGGGGVADSDTDDSGDSTVLTRFVGRADRFKLDTAAVEHIDREYHKWRVQFDVREKIRLEREVGG